MWLGNNYGVAYNYNNKCECQNKNCFSHFAKLLLLFNTGMMFWNYTSNLALLSPISGKSDVKFYEILSNNH